MEVGETILQILEVKHKSSGGRCGTYLPEIVRRTGLDLQEVKDQLNVLYKQKKIKIRPGAHGRLIFLKP